jgi:hypothetical protein
LPIQPVAGTVGYLNHHRSRAAKMSQYHDIAIIGIVLALWIGMVAAMLTVG